MECLASNINIRDTFSEISRYSYKFTKESQDQIINTFLDQVNNLQKEIRTHREFFDNIVERFEKLTWANDIENDEASLNTLNDIIGITRQLHLKFLKYWIELNKNFKSVAKTEISLLKITLDDLKEATQDLEDVFFNLPKNSDFQEANKKIQSL